MKKIVMRKLWRESVTHRLSKKHTVVIYHGIILLMYKNEYDI